MHAFYYSLGLFGILEFIGDVYPDLIVNYLCFPVLGCNTGFFGYDGFMHFISGICVGLGIIWTHEKGYAKKSPTLAAFVSWSLAIALAWEMVEWSYDLVRIYLFHMDLAASNQLTQPSGIDTAGDVILALLGTALVYWWNKHKAEAPAAVSA